MLNGVLLAAEKQNFSTSVARNFRLCNFRPIETQLRNDIIHLNKFIVTEACMSSFVRVQMQSEYKVQRYKVNKCYNPFFNTITLVVKK